MLRFRVLVPLFLKTTLNSVPTKSTSKKESTGISVPSITNSASKLFLNVISKSGIPSNYIDLNELSKSKNTCWMDLIVANV